MIKKRREVPLRLKQEEALLRRLPANHKKREEILKNLKKRKAGYRGEMELDYHLKFLPEKDYFLFQNLRLSYKDFIFQMDTLILSPWIALIIESKNIYGHLYFDPVSKQLIRTFDQIKEGFPDPILQVKRQERLFQQWISQFMIKPCPTLSFVSIGYPSTIVETSPSNQHIFEKVLHAERIPEKILSLSRSQQHFSTYQLRKLTELLIENHLPEPPNDVLGEYAILPSDLIQGIPCPSCHHSPMNRTHGNWQCRSCHTKTKDAHQQTIEDHLLLHGSITNEQCRNFLNLSSIHTATRILKTMNLKSEGKNKGRVYYPSTSSESYEDEKDRKIKKKKPIFP